jgi:hypothetical protein
MRPDSTIAWPRRLGTREWLSAVEERIATLDPRPVLGGFVVLQWLTLVVFAFVVRHNGWLFYQGGDETFHYSSAWSIAHGHVPESEIGFGWAYILSPIALVAGSNFLSALPVVVILQTVVLMPVALFCVYGIAARIGGRFLGYFAAALWVVAPYASIPLWDHRYHQKYVEQFLPQAFGLTGLADYASMVCVLVACYLCMRVLDEGAWVDAALAGLAAGYAVAIKPANALFLGGPLLAFLAARRFRPGLVFGAAMAPALAALALWKLKGLGHLPFLTPAPKALALGAGSFGAGDLPLGLVVSRYLHFDWYRMHQNYLELREFFWSTRLLQWLPLAGFLAAGRRSWPKALLLAGWMGGFVLVKGSSDQASIESGILLRLFLPGFPPVLIFTALIPLLVPTVGPRLWQRFPVRTRPIRWRAPWVLASGAVFAAIPVLLFLALPPLRAHAVVKYFDENVVVPVDNGFTVHVGRGGGGELVTWKPPSSVGTNVFYRVYRSRPTVQAPDPTLPPGHEGIRCLPLTTYGRAGAVDCRVEMTYLGSTRAHSFVDKPPAGPWTYRIGLTSNWLDDTSLGDVVLFSGPGRLSAFH